MKKSELPAALLRSLTAAVLVSALVSLPVSAQSLAPPHAPIIEGQPVPVLAHPDPGVLLKSTSASLAANKQLVFDYWRTVIEGGQHARLDDYIGADYIEHNPLLPTTREAFRRYLAQTLKPAAVPSQIPELVTLVAEGPWVAMVLVAHYPHPQQAGTTYTSSRFELFRLADGRIVEHWDSSLFRAGQQVPDYGADQALPVVGLQGTAQYALLANDDPQLFANKRLAFDLWRQIPEGGREEVAELYVDPLYIQHNPNAATGRDGFVEYMARRPDSSIDTALETPLVAMVAEGDLVVQVLETTRNQNGVTYRVPWFDMFRVENGRVIEHWDTASIGELPAATPGGPLGL